MAIAAIDLGQVADFDRMLEFDGSHGGWRSLPFLLAEYGMTGIAFLGNDFTLGADMLAVMAAEAPVEIEVSNIVGMGFPVQLHLQELCAGIYLLDFIDGISDVEFTIFSNIRIFALVEIVNFFRNSLLSRFGCGVVSRERRYRLLLDKWQRNIDAFCQ